MPLSLSLSPVTLEEVTVQDVTVLDELPKPL